MLSQLFLTELENIVFVVGDIILPDDAHAMILSLLEEFDRIANTNLRHDLELIQRYYIEGTGPVQIILKYVDSQIYCSQGFVQTDKVECNISRGLVRFYLRKHDKDAFTYIPIKVVKINLSKSSLQFQNQIYQSNDEIIITGKQIPTFLLSTPQESIDKMNLILDKANDEIITSQLDQLNMSKFKPTQTMIDTAKVISKLLSDTDNILAPGNEPIPFQSKMSVTNVPATITPAGLTPAGLTPAGLTDKTHIDTIGQENTLNSKQVNTRASLIVDANLVIEP